MTGPKLTAMILFGVLSFLFGALFSVGLNGALSAALTGAVVAALTCAFIWFAQTGRHAFARGFLGLGAVFIVVPIAALAGLGELVSDTSIAAWEAGGLLTEQEATDLALSSIFASAGLIFGIVIGLILVLIGGLMHRRTTPATTP